jgi:hypothetical protein
MSPVSGGRVLESVGRTILEMREEELRQKRAARNIDAGKNLPNAVADVSIAAPAEWEEELRRISPINTIHSHLRFYWYRAASRWVLYDVLPVEQIPDDLDTGSMLSGRDLKEIMAGPRPSEREDFQDLDTWPVSDTQHEMFRVWRGFARPFWVLQGDAGGHQVKFSPDQSSALLRMGLPAEPPRVGELPPCPFDNRAVQQLQHLNRLHQLEDSIDRLRQSGSPEAARAEQERVERQIRDSEMAFIEAQMRPVVEMSTSLVSGANTRSEHADEIIRVAPGMAARAKDAYDRYRETGDYTL